MHYSYQSPVQSHHLIVNELEYHCFHINRADSRLALSQWEKSLQSNPLSHWLGANLE